MAEISERIGDGSVCQLALNRSEAVVVALALSATARQVTPLPKFTAQMAASLVELLRPVAAPPGTLVGELYDLLAPAEEASDGS